MTRPDTRSTPAPTGRPAAGASSATGSDGGLDGASDSTTGPASLLEGLPLPALVIELGDGRDSRDGSAASSDRVVAENAAASALLGPPRSPPGRGAEEFVAAADRAAWRSLLRARAAGTPSANAAAADAPLSIGLESERGVVVVDVHAAARAGAERSVLVILVPRPVERLRDALSEEAGIRVAEQKRIARELHDQLGADLSLLRIELARIAPKLRWGRRDVRETVERMRDHAGELLETVRRISRELRPRVLDHVSEVGLAAVLEYVTADVHRRTGLVVHLDARLTPEDDAAVDASRAEAAYHVVRESLHNVVRHAHATRAMVSARVESGAARDAALRGDAASPDARVLVVEVLDDGRGVVAPTRRAPDGVRAGAEAASGARSVAGGADVEAEPSAVEAVADAGGIGWLSLTERVRAFGGELAVRAQPGVGTTVAARIPLAIPAHRSESAEGAQGGAS